MSVNNHCLDHDYIFLKITDRRGYDREIVMKKNEGYGDHLYNYIGDLEDCGDSWQLHTRKDDIIVVGRWWSRKRIGCINGEVGWVCRNNDFITHRLGATLFAPLNLMIDTAFEAIGDPYVDEKIKGLTNDEVTAFIVEGPIILSKKVQRIFFGEVQDESAPEETEADDGTDDDSGYTSSSSDNSGYDYDSSSSSSSSTTANNANTGSQGSDDFFFALIFGTFLFICCGIGSCYCAISNCYGTTKAQEPTPAVNDNAGWGGVIKSATTSEEGEDDSSLQVDSQAKENVVAESAQTSCSWATLPTPPPPVEAVEVIEPIKDIEPPPPPLKTRNQLKIKSGNVFDQSLIEEENRNFTIEDRLRQQERERRRRNPVSPEQSRRAEAAGRDALGRSPFERLNH